MEQWSIWCFIKTTWTHTRNEFYAIDDYNYSKLSGWVRAQAVINHQVLSVNWAASKESNMKLIFRSYLYLVIHSYIYIYNCVTLFSHCLSKLCTCVIIDVTYTCFLVFSLVPLPKHLRHSKLNLREKQTTAWWSSDLHLSDVILLAEFLKIKNIICFSSWATTFFFGLSKARKSRSVCRV